MTPDASRVDRTDLNSSLAWLPRFFQRVRVHVRRLKVRRAAQSYRNLSTRQIFERVYSTGAWGGSKTGFNSGSGSTDQAALEYVALIKDYVRTNKVRHIVDLGCGDFRVGQSLIENEVVAYTGVDVVCELITTLEHQYGRSGVRFLCRDITEEELPEGDIYLLRQVLQHLSNKQIFAILSNVAGRKVIVTEHLPVGAGVRWNLDKLPGPDIRLYSGSGVFLEHPPFNRRIATLLEVPCRFNGLDGVLRTSLMTPQSQ